MITCLSRVLNVYVGFLDVYKHFPRKSLHKHSLCYFFHSNEPKIEQDEITPKVYSMVKEMHLNSKSLITKIYSALNSAVLTSICQFAICPGRGDGSISIIPSFLFQTLSIEKLIPSFFWCWRFLQVPSRWTWLQICKETIRAQIFFRRNSRFYVTQVPTLKRSIEVLNNA